MALSADSLPTRWYAAHTCANHEKRVREHLEQKSVESFLPTYESIRRWKDRRMRLRLPLFPGYLFVRMTMADHLSVLRVPSVVRLVGINGKPSALPDEEIAALRAAQAGGGPSRTRFSASAGACMLRTALSGEGRVSSSGEKEICASSCRSTSSCAH